MSDQGSSPVVGPEEVESIAAEATELVDRGLIPFHRGQPLEQIRRLAKLNAHLTLPLPYGGRTRDVVLLKILYTLWNYMIDDELDRAHSMSGVDASIDFLLCAERGQDSPASPAGGVLAMMASKLPAGALARCGAVGFDLWEVLHGLTHEWFINRNRARATVFEYRRYSVLTASMKVLLDIDWSLAERTPGAPVYQALREAYDELTSAVKLASDIGTLERELKDENNLNVLILLARRDPPPGGEGGRADTGLADALRHRDDVAALARAHLRRAADIVEQVGAVNASGLVQAARSIVEVYLAGVDPFFAKKPA